MTRTVNVPLLRKAVEFAEASAARQRPFKETRPTARATAFMPDKLDPMSDSADVVWNQRMWALVRDPNLPAGLTEQERAARVENCGTAYCIAGYVSSLEPGYVSEVKVAELSDGAGLLYLDEAIDGVQFDHSDVARDALGLTEDQADRLFAASNTVSDVRRIAEEFTGERL